MRCSCGKSSAYLINYRQSSRTSSSIGAQAVPANTKERRIQVCETSTDGIGFLIPIEFPLSLHRADEIRIKYQGGGALTQRPLAIKNMNGNRVGAPHV